LRSELVELVGEDVVEDHVALRTMP